MVLKKLLSENLPHILQTMCYSLEATLLKILERIKDHEKYTKNLENLSIRSKNKKEGDKINLFKDKTIMCFTCGKSGHKSKDCRKNV
ncbi:hypothetical protein H311_05296, partial [Anncaliia algerae PRA109]